MSIFSVTEKTAADAQKMGIAPGEKCLKTYVLVTILKSYENEGVAIMTISASELRQNIYRILDRVAETGIPEEINRRGHLLRIISTQKKSKLSNAKKRPIIKGDPEDLVHTNWAHLWRP
jgi:prevent-host-death family protein